MLTCDVLTFYTKKTKQNKQKSVPTGRERVTLNRSMPLQHITAGSESGATRDGDKSKGRSSDWKQKWKLHDCWQSRAWRREICLQWMMGASLLIHTQPIQRDHMKRCLYSAPASCMALLKYSHFFGSISTVRSVHLTTLITSVWVLLLISTYSLSFVIWKTWPPCVFSSDGAVRSVWPVDHLHIFL